MRSAAPLCLLAAACSDGARPPQPAPAATAHAAAAIRFRDTTERSGVRFVHEAGRTQEKHLPETMGAGAALVDVDEDGDLDLYLVQGGALVREAGAAPAGPTNALWTNHGDGTFEDATAKSGAAADPGYGMGVAVGDADGDGRADLLVTNFGPDVLLLGDGRGAFAAAAPELSDPRWTTGAAFLDADRDGDLDLYVAAYVEVDLEHPAWCGRREPGWRTVCHPDRYPGLQDRFYENRGGASFADATVGAGLSDSWGKGLGVVASDLDRDGWLDLYVANDSTENRLWRNEGGRFSDATLLSGTGVDGNGTTEAGMGLAAGDVDGDGDVDLYVTNFDHESHTLYANLGGLLFVDATAPAGIEAPTRLPVGFGTVLADLDDDGDLDLAVANGHIVDCIRLYDEAQTWAQRAQLFVNDGGGRFSDGSDAAGDLCAAPRVGRGLACGDLDGDGDLDLVATECGGPARVLTNEGPGGRAVVLAGLPQGALVEARFADGSRQVREAGPQPSYLSPGAPEVHLGLGAAGNRLVALAVGGTAVLLPAPLAAGRVRLERAADGWIVKIP